MRALISPSSVSSVDSLPDQSGFPRLFRGALRCGMALAGLLWICCATVMCGCNSINGYVMNESGKAYYRRGDYSLARHEFERALMDSPENPNYAYNVAAAMQQQGDVIAAERVYQQALMLDPSHQPAYEGLAHLLNSQGRTAEAEQLLTAWASTQPYVPESNLALARLQQNRGDLGAAEQSLQHALAANPRQRQVHNELGKLYRRSGRNREAADSFGNALGSNPYDVEAQMELASLYHTQNQGMSPALLMANQMPQFDPTLRATGTGQIVTAPYAGAPAITQNSAPSVYGNMYGASAYGPISAPLNWGTPAAVPTPQSTNLAAHSQMQMQQMQMSPQMQMPPMQMSPQMQPPMGWEGGMSAMPDTTMSMAPQGQYHGPMATSSPAMMEVTAAPRWGVQRGMPIAPQMMNQATQVNYAPMSYPGSGQQVMQAGGMSPSPQSTGRMSSMPAPAMSQVLAVPAF